ncbi:MAG: c-type cytochrome [Candidatus Eisenbacteria bacterium]|uniref:C-type cytochrome n=1 Tax=Eiseniibacteriota bacterium TaxID=2212470 RepID=A0A538UAR4_UNCEI|nr:MAG: c-type cytochrome [Candidatus Eisenbacteria bacterium]
MRARGLFRPCRIVYIRRFVRTERVFLRVAASSLLAVAAVGLGWGCAAPTVGIARGRELFQNCQPCHGDRGTGNVALRAPEIAGLPQWYVAAELDKFQKNVRGAHPDDNEGHRMRPMARTLYHPGDIESVAGYVASLPSVSVTPMMRGNDAKGNQAMNAPPLSAQADWYLVAQLEKFKTGMRGVNAQDMTGSQMRAMSSTLSDTTAMHDVVAFIKTLSH